MDDLRDRVLRGDLVQDVRRLLEQGADHHWAWLRENARLALATRGQDAVAVSALTGLAPGTVRGFLNGRPSSIRNVLLIGEAIGCTLGELDQPPEAFERALHEGQDGVGGAIGPSLLAFERSAAAMAVFLLDGTIVKVNRRFRELLKYEESELIGAAAETLTVQTDGEQALRRDALAADGVVPEHATQLRRKDGSLVSAVTSAIIIRDHAGEPRYVIARAVLADAE